jgi:Flp pilus assembly protein TadB
MNALQLWVLAGLMVSGGLVAVGWYFAPAQPDLADALGRITPTGAARQSATDPEERPELSDRLGLWAMRHLPTRTWGATPTRDLAILGRSTHRFYGEKLLFAAIIAAAAPVLTAIFSMTVPIPTPATIALVLVGALFGWLVPNGNIATAASEARLEFNRALGSYVDLVALERSAGGSAARQALESAAEIGDSWPFRRIRDELARSRFSGEPPWDAIHHLADELGLPTLDDVADIMRLAGAEGTQVYDTLRARSTALRSALLAAEQTKANSLSARMAIPTTLMAIVFCVIHVTPAVLRLAAG